MLSSASNYWHCHPLYYLSHLWWWRWWLWIKESLMKLFKWIWFWWATLCDGEAHTWLKEGWDRWDMANLVASGCWMLGLSRSEWHSSVCLAKEIVSIFAYFAVEVFGGWSHSVWYLFFDLTAMFGPTGVGASDSFALGITGTCKPSIVTMNNHIYFTLDGGVNSSLTNISL